MVMTEGGQTRKDTQGQGGTYRDKEGRNDLVMTEGGKDYDKEGQSRTRRVVKT